MFDKADTSMPGHYTAQQTALMLLDFHGMFTTILPKGTEAMGNAAKLRDWAKAQGIEVIHCLIDVDGQRPKTCKDSGRFQSIAQAMKENNGIKEPEILTSGAGQNEKTFLRVPGHVSALQSPGLVEYLRERGITSLLFTGLSASGCVMHTALAAPDANFVSTVFSDCTADSDDATHDMVVSKIVNKRGYVSTVAEFQAGYQKA